MILIDLKKSGIPLYPLILEVDNPFDFCSQGVGKLRDLTGQRFGLLEVLRFHSFEKSPSGRTITKWAVKCDCGTDEQVVRSECLVRGKTRSCGCIRRARAGGFPISSGRGRVMPNGRIVPLAKPTSRTL